MIESAIDLSIRMMSATVAAAVSGDEMIQNSTRIPARIPMKRPTGKGYDLRFRVWSKMSQIDEPLGRPEQGSALCWRAPSTRSATVGQDGRDVLIQIRTIAPWSTSAPGSGS
jgi:hypothetical protein